MPIVTDDYRDAIQEALIALAELEPPDETACWMASLSVPLDVDPPERINPFTGEPIRETWAQRAARLLDQRVRRMEEKR